VKKYEKIISYVLHQSIPYVYSKKIRKDA